MLGKNKKLQEKMNTQVVNLQEIGVEYANEKKKKNLSLFLLFVGLFMIIMGILFPVIMGTVQEESKLQAVAVDTEPLSCIKSEKNGGIVVNTNYIYEFNQSGLIKMKIMANLVTAGEAVDTAIELFDTAYESISAPGLETEIKVDHDTNSLTTIFSVDYNSFNLEDFKNEHSNDSFRLAYLEFTKGLSRETVVKKIVEQGGTCQ